MADYELGGNSSSSGALDGAPLSKTIYIECGIDDLVEKLREQPKNTIDTPYKVNITNLSQDDLSNEDDRYSRLVLELFNAQKDSDEQELEEIQRYVDLSPIVLNGITSLKHSFKGCSVLVNTPTFSDSITDMEGCFEKCENLVSCEPLPSSVQVLKRTFEECTSLTKPPIIPEGVINMEGCFERCESLEYTPVLPNSLENMNQTFVFCNKITKVSNIPSHVKYMMHTFINCESLKYVPNIPSTVTNLRETFRGCKSLKRIENCKINGSILELYNDTFANTNNSFLLCITQNSYNSITNKLQIMGFTGVISIIVESVSDFNIFGQKVSDFPTGCVTPYFGTNTPSGFLECDGESYAIDNYKELYKVLGGETSPWIKVKTEGFFNVPDFSELVPVGVGHNETYEINEDNPPLEIDESWIQNHDEFELGEFKDDQFQDHTHVYQRCIGLAKSDKDGSKAYARNDSLNEKTKNMKYDKDDSVTSEVTHGKRIGVKYIIKY